MHRRSSNAPHGLSYTVTLLQGGQQRHGFKPLPDSSWLNLLRAMRCSMPAGMLKQALSTRLPAGQGAEPNDSAGVGVRWRWLQGELCSASSCMRRLPRHSRLRSLAALDAACESTLYANVALCRLKTQEPALALSAADMSLKAEMGNEKARYHRARAYELLGQSINAHRDYAAVSGKDAASGRRRLEKKLRCAADSLASIKAKSMTPTSMQLMNCLWLKDHVRMLHTRTSHRPCHPIAMRST